MERKPGTHGAAVYGPGRARKNRNGLLVVFGSVNWKVPPTAVLVATGLQVVRFVEASMTYTCPDWPFTVKVNEPLAWVIAVRLTAEDNATSVVRFRLQPPATLPLSPGELSST